MEQSQLAQRAMETATVALTEIRAHGVNCERRYQEQSAIMRDVRDELKALSGRVEAATHGPATEANQRNWALRLGMLNIVGTGLVLAALKLFHLG